jgi:uncharacterized membrane protein YdbT with pleckstrin-like domain
MSYVEQVLQPGEQIRHVSSIHWIGYWPGVALALLAAVAYCLSDARLLTGLWRYTAYALALVAAVLLVQEWLKWWVTEIAVTNRRVIYKTGLIWRQTNEMSVDKVESVQINQTILGRLLDYGTVTILGTGEGGFETLRTVAGPLKLRNSITAPD